MSQSKSLTREDVLKIARLSNLHVTEDEVQSTLVKLNAILGYLSVLDKADVTGVEPMSHVHGATNVFRADVTQPSMPVEELLKLAPDSSGRFIRTPLVVDHD